MFEKILIANRGEIACRVIRTCRKLGIGTAAVHSEADSRALHARMADESVCIGPPPAIQSYIDIDRILEAVAATGADAVHPGYGFLSENRKFAEALDRKGVAFIGPPAEAIEAMGDKITSKLIAARAGVSTVPGQAGKIEGPDHALEIARDIGFPVMIKASAGGGGKGMRIAASEDELLPGIQSAGNEAASSFGDDSIFLEKFIERPRHVEIQVLADRHGNCIYLNERECSIQRRNQKVIEEAPSPFLDEETRAAMGRQAVELARAVEYCSAGTVEFIVDSDRKFYFLEMNTRLQVEHPVTELITGIDLVEQMIRVAAGEELQFEQADIGINGWALESRIYAEDPYREFLPSVGRLTRYRPPAESHTAESAIRNDTGVFEGGEIPIHYDPMIAKLCSWGRDREHAIEVMRSALDRFEIEGISSNLPFLSAVMDNVRFESGDITTAFIDEEFPGGFSGVNPDDALARQLAAAAALMHCLHEERRSGLAAAHDRAACSDLVVQLSSGRYGLTVCAAASKVTFDDGSEIGLTTDWCPGSRLAEFRFGDTARVMKTDRARGGFRIRYRGFDEVVRVRTPLQASLGKIVEIEVAEEESAQLLCPMPGIMVSFAVSQGDEVQAGRPLCTIEAMKMENVLRADRTVRIGRIHPAPGDILAVNDVIMDFD